MGMDSDKISFCFIGLYQRNHAPSTQNFQTINKKIKLREQVSIFTHVQHFDQTASNPKVKEGASNTTDKYNENITKPYFQV
jgi:hypothetical protein